MVIIGLPVYYSIIPSEPTVNEAHTDAIIVLTGGAGRVQEGVLLYSKGMAEQLLITGAGSQTKPSELLATLDLPKSELRRIDMDNITLGRKAQTTIGNAIETADWVRANNVKSIRLVTANYHMPRATLEFKRLMPEITIIQHPVFPKDFDTKNVTESKPTQDLVVSEYLKFLYSWLGF